MMLKVSGIFLLCGLLALSCAEEMLNDKFIKLFIKNFIGRGNFTSNNEFLGTFQISSSDLPGQLGSWFLGNSPQVQVQLRGFHLSKFYLENNPRSHEASLMVPISFELLFKYPGISLYTLKMKSDFRVQFYVQKDQEGRYQLIFGNCKLSPEDVHMQPTSLEQVINYLRSIRSHLRSTVAYYVEKMMCPMIEKTLSNLENHSDISLSVTGETLQKIHESTTSDISSK